MKMCRNDDVTPQRTARTAREPIAANPAPSCCRQAALGKTGGTAGPGAPTMPTTPIQDGDGSSLATRLNKTARYPHPLNDTQPNSKNVRTSASRPGTNRPQGHSGYRRSPTTPRARLVQAAGNTDVGAVLSWSVVRTLQLAEAVGSWCLAIAAPHAAWNRFSGWFAVSGRPRTPAWQPVPHIDAPPRLILRR